MSKFQVGDEVICIRVGRMSTSSDPNGIPPPLRLGGRYVIQGITTCSGCGAESVDVGLGGPDELGTLCGCGDAIPPSQIHWCYATRFEKPKTNEEKIAEAVEKEDYELAAKLSKENDLFHK